MRLYKCPTSQTDNLKHYNFLIVLKELCNIYLRCSSKGVHNLNCQNISQVQTKWKDKDFDDLQKEKKILYCDCLFHRRICGVIGSNLLKVYLTPKVFMNFGCRLF